MFDKIVVANRGEIACRIMATCREMGIATVAVFSDADREALHVLSADEAVYIGASAPSKSYLNMDRIIAAAKETGAVAIHPGYGFLAENGDFAERCKEEGLVFIGPPADVIRNLGNKIKARIIMKEGGVPVTPGMVQPVEVYEVIEDEAEKIGYPVLIKASAGGGGKGIRIVETAEELEDALHSARREAKAAFGDGSVYMEKFFRKARHVEFQILADNHGNVVHLLERECSIQRRHQKIIEESPSSALTPELRAKMGEAAVAAARASGYVNAGTVEFLLDDEGNFYFLEVNTRLQVEHPVTEMVTGIDLVRQQISIAAGNPLGFSQDDVIGRGHAIECRVYAEDPENDFFPSPGRIEYMKEPSGPGIRNDAGVYAGCEVPVDYDPVISKLIVHAGNRKQAREKMIRALGDYVLLGVKNSIPFLKDILKSEAFISGDIHTSFISDHFQNWVPDCDDIDLALVAFIVDELEGEKRRTGPAPADAVPTPWETLGNWRG